MVTRSESAGLTVALVGHVALFGLLSLGFLVTPNPIALKSEPIEVSIVDEVGLESQAPVISTEAPQTQIAPDEGPVEPEPAPAEPSKPEPAKAEPKPATKPVPDPNAQKAKPQKSTQSAPAQQTAKTEPRKSTGLLGSDFEKGLTAEKTTGKALTPPATTIGPEVKSSLVAAIRRMLKPNWTAPTGADADQLRTFVRVKLDKDGKLAEARVVKQEGKTDLNRPQWELHAERALAAVRKTRFDTTILKDEYYSVWGDFTTVFDKRL